LRAAVVGGRQEAVVGVGHGRHDEEGREGRVGHGLEVHHGRVVHEVRGGGEVDERRARRRLHGRLAGAVGAQAPAALRAEAEPRAEGLARRAVRQPGAALGHRHLAHQRGARGAHVLRGRARRHAVAHHVLHALLG
ncbi:hypothetical protein EG861_14540, partial [Enterococcus faecalis]